MQIPSHFDPTVQHQLDRIASAPPQVVDAAVEAGTGFGPSSTGTDGATLGSSVVTLTQTALAQPDVRGARVEQLRNQISSGTYQVSPTQVATALLADPLTGLGSIARD